MSIEMHAGSERVNVQILLLYNNIFFRNDINDINVKMS